jgi:arsenate reductase
MAEALLQHHGGDRIEALSAGSHPAGFITPLARDVMRHLGVGMEGQRSKSWHEFADRPVDLVITLCDDAAATPCPVWPGSPVQVHWPLPDPTFHEGTPEERFNFALAVALRLKRKILALLDMPLHELPPDRLRAELAALAKP